MKSLTLWVLTGLALLVGPAGRTALAEEKVSADAIVAKIEGSLAPKNFKATYKFTNHRTDGTTMVYEVQFQTRDVDHSHGYFLKPEREKGREVLRLADVIWSYIPGAGRAVRIADRDSFAGGDFSNADVLRIDWSKKFSAEILKDLPNQWIIELKAKVDDAAYAKMRIWVEKKSGQPVQQQYYDKQGTLLKKCLYGSTTKFGSIERPAKLLMENVLTKQRSELEVLEMVTVESLPDSRFVVDNLGK